MIIYRKPISRKIREKFSFIFFNIWKWLYPSFQSFSREYNRMMFFKNEMSHSFQWKKNRNKDNPYFKKWGFKVSCLDAEYYSRVSGIKADYYVNRSMAVHYIYPYLCGFDFVTAYMDKNIQKRVLGLQPIDKELDVQGTKDIVTCSNGVFFDKDFSEISQQKALQVLLDYGRPMIVKPSLETYGGHGVALINPSAEIECYKDLFGKYNYNFSFQELVEQHPDLAVFNPSSVNTIRIVTYRKPNRERKVLYSCLRFGGSGSVIDNVCSGGGYTGIDVDSGRLINRKKYSYFTMDMPLLPDYMPDVIPYWDKITNAALTLHGRLPHFDIIGWDFSVNPDGQLILIEYNLRPGVGLQQAVGPMFSKEDLDELMESVSKVKSEFKLTGHVKFNTKLKKESTITHFGFQYI